MVFLYERIYRTFQKGGIANEREIVCTDLQSGKLGQHRLDKARAYVKKLQMRIVRLNKKVITAR